MSTIDIILLVFLGIGFIWGCMRGFVAQLVSLLGAMVGFLVACALYSTLGNILAPQIGASPTIGHILAFFLIWICVPLLCTMVGKFITNILEKIKLGWLNRLFGGAFGFFKVLLFLSVILTLLEFIDKYNSNPLIKVETKENSVLYYPVQEFAGKLLPSDFLHRNTTDPKAVTIKV